jgi:hypothetical protein
MQTENENDEFIKFSNILDQIVNKKILLKLNKNNNYYADGRILYFSSFIKRLCCNSKDFNFRLDLDLVERDVLSNIVQFLNIIDWDTETYMFDVKLEELNNWYETNKSTMYKIEETATYLKIDHIFNYLRYREKIRSI